MQSTHGLKPDQIKPKRGQIFGEAILGQYETDSGILIVKDLKRNPPINKIKVLSVGGPFDRFKNKKRIPGVYWAKPGETAYMKKATATRGVVILQGKTYVFLDNEDIVAVI